MIDFKVISNCSRHNGGDIFISGSIEYLLLLIFRVKW